jgi:hypothetical protein
VRYAVDRTEEYLSPAGLSALISDVKAASVFQNGERGRYSDTNTNTEIHNIGRK